MSTTRTPRKDKIQINNDQFFVLSYVAAKIAKFIKRLGFYSKIKYVIEPAAGNGELLIHFWGDKKRIVEGYDLDPQIPIAPYLHIKQRDFFDFACDYEPTLTLIITGPPFGKRSSMAIKFFNHAAKFADFIGMILPRSFISKESIHKRLNADFTLYDELELEDESFYLPAEGPNQVPYPVPCVFQIWYRRPNGPGRPRKISSRVTRNTPKSVDDFEFVKDPNEADLTMIITGWSAGQIVDRHTSMCKENICFIRIKQNTRKVVSFFKDDSWKYIKDHVVGPRSISKKDIIKAYLKKDL